MSDTIVLSLFGLLVTAGGSAIAHLYHLMSKSQEQAEHAVDTRFAEMAESIHRLATRMESEREILTEARLKMATRDDLERQTKQILNEIDRRVAWTKAPGRGHLPHEPS